MGAAEFMPTLAEQLVEVVVQAGVRRIYGVVGDSLNPAVDAIRRSGGSARGGIDWVYVRNEEAGAFTIPPTITAEGIRGFALAVSRTVLGGGVGKMLALARSNLRNIPRP